MRERSGMARCWLVAFLVVASWSSHGFAQWRQVRSDDGRYSVAAVRRSGVTRIVVTERRTGTAVEIDPNPGGEVNRGSLDVRFTAGDNVLVRWGCGSECTVAALFSPAGVLLASLDAHEVSPAGDLALGYPTWSSREVTLWDLRTGTALWTRSISSDAAVCRMRWRARSVALVPCDDDAQPVTLRLHR